MALMGTGVANGENRAIEAARKAISSPLLEDVSINGATGIIINITGGADMTLFEVNEASSLITEEAHEDAEIIFGSVIDESLTDEVRVTVIATGFNPVVQGELEAAQSKTEAPKDAATVVAGEASASANLVAPPVQQRETPLPADLKSARQLAREIGKRFFETEEYDIPTFLRRQHD
jgi:cell division protein FtsZ